MTGESLQQATKRLDTWTGQVDDARQELDHALAGAGATHPGARASLVGAALDAQAHRKRVTLPDLLNLPSGQCRSSITLSVDDVDNVLAEATQRVDEGWSAFKVKLGGAHDETVLGVLRDRFPAVPLSADANEAWTLARAQALWPMLRRLEVDYVEQPLARTAWQDLATLARDESIPILLDESVLDSHDLTNAISRKAAHGVNVKLAKCGGAWEARRMVKVARDYEWRVMVGCNLETSLGLTFSAAFAGVVDWLDLDGAHLLAQDPWPTPAVGPTGTVRTPDTVGAGPPPPMHALPKRR